MHRSLVTAAVCWLAALIPSTLQAQPTFSFQGLLTDSSGDPVVDGSYGATFKLYASALGGSAIWTETQSVTTSQGIYNVQFGGVTSIAGIDFSQPLWLGVTVAPDAAEMTPRTPLSSVPSALSLALPFGGSVSSSDSGLQIENSGDGNAIFGTNTGEGTAGAFIVDNPTNDYTGVYGESNGTGPAVYGRHIGTGHAGRFLVDNPASDAPAIYVENAGTGMGIFSRDTIYVQTTDLGLTQSARANEDLIVEDADALIGLYSNGAGAFGSGIQLGQADVFGDLVDKWSIVRRTASGAEASALLFTYGTDNSYGENPTHVQMAADGRVIVPAGYIQADSLVYNQPKTNRISFPASAFAPDRVDNLVEYVADNRFAYMTAGSSRAFLAPAHLPDGAVITKLYCWMYDVDAALNLTCNVSRYNPDTEASTILANVATSGSSGAYELEAVPVVVPDPVDNLNHSYFVTMNTIGTWPGNNLRVRQIVVEYTVESAQ